MAPDHLGLETVQLEQLLRLRVLPRRDLDVVPLLAQDRDQRPEDEHMRARRHVDPDLQAPTASATRSFAQRARRSLDVRLVPEREREQAPELARQVRAARDVVVEHAPDGGRLEVALPPERLVREDVARERLELAAQPGRGGDREAALAAVHDLAREQRLGRLPQQRLLAEPAHLVARRQRVREVGDDRVEERDARLERVRHRGAVGLHEQVVDEVDAHVDVLEAGEQLGALASRRTARGARRPDPTRAGAR